MSENGMSIYSSFTVHFGYWAVRGLVT